MALILLSQILGQEALHQAYPHFLVGKVKGVLLGDVIIILDGEVTALVQKGNDVGHTLRRGIKIIDRSLLRTYLLGEYAIFV